jgi:hypothetical protein
MTYSENGPQDDDKVYRADLAKLAGAFRAYVGSGWPGVGAVFVYAVRPKWRAAFWRFAGCLASLSGTSLAGFWHTHQGGNRNLVALFLSGLELPEDFPPAGIFAGQD